jgi:hypothetical protein
VSSLKKEERLPTSYELIMFDENKNPWQVTVLL